MKVGLWTTVAANNNNAPPDGWPEGQAPSTVNDCAREMMGQLRVAFSALEYTDLANTPSFLTATTFSMGSADVVNCVVGRRVKLGDGSNTLYGFINSVSTTFVSVQLDSGTIDNSLSTVAYSVVTPNNPSVPENVWKRKNIIINGNMEIWQRSATFAVGAAASVNTADRFKMVTSLSANASVNVTRWERSAAAGNVPTVLQSGVLFDSSLIISVSTIASVVAAGQFAALEYDVEGFDFRMLAQRPMNLSFWCNTRQSGIYAVALRNTANGQSFVQNFTVSAIAAWTRFSIPIVKSPSTGTWDYSTGIGLRVSFVLAAGSTFQGGAGNWTAANIMATASQVNFYQSAGNTFAITGIQLEPGSFGTPIETRHYLQELQLCKRYCNAVPSFGMLGFCTATTQGLYSYTYPIEMRAAPTFTPPTLTNIVVTNGTGVAQSVSAIASNVITAQFIDFLINPVGTPFTGGQGSIFLMSAGAVDKFILDAEL